eukprot:scaffold31537_cov19-Tisochrysis_lutea.AAC.1
MMTMRLSKLAKDITNSTGAFQWASESRAPVSLHVWQQPFGILEQVPLTVGLCMLLAQTVETIGDAYMCAGNLRHPQPDTHAALMADFAFGCCAAANEEPVCLSRPDMGFIHIRVGIHTGPVTGAVVGTLNRR